MGLGDNNDVGNVGNVGNVGEIPLISSGIPTSSFTGATGASDASAIGDTGASDTGASDTGASDTGASDTGASDTGASDTGTSDSGASDSGANDSGASDSGASEEREAREREEREREEREREEREREEREREEREREEKEETEREEIINKEIDNDFMMKEIKSLLEMGEGNRIKEIFEVYEEGDDVELYKRIKESDNYLICKKVVDTMLDMNENIEKIRKFMKIYSRNVEGMRFMTPEMICTRFFMIGDSEVNKMGRMGDILEEKLMEKNRYLTEIIQMACLCYIHVENRDKGYIANLPNKLKELVIQELLYLLLYNVGDSEDNIIVLKEIIENLSDEDIRIIQERYDIIKDLTDIDSEKMNELLKIYVDPLIKRQEELSKMRLNNIGKEERVKNKDCEMEETNLLNQIKNREKIIMNREKLLFLDKCSKERQESLRLLKDN